MVIDIELASRTGIIRFLLHVLGEGPIEMAPILACVFLHLVDSPRTRAYIQVGTDLEVWSIAFCHWTMLTPLLDGTLGHNRCLWKGT